MHDFCITFSNIVKMNFFVKGWGMLLQIVWRLYVMVNLFVMVAG